MSQSVRAALAVILPKFDIWSSRLFLLLPDDYQPQKAEDSDTSDVQAVPVQTVLLLSCAGFKNRSHTTDYSLVPSVTETQHEYLYLNLGTEGGTLEGFQSASLNH